MEELALSVGEPFTSPAWGSNFVVFAGETGQPIPEADTKEYLGRCCKYAKHFQAWLVPERFILMGYQCMGLINPEGKVLGAQKAICNGPAFKSQAKRSATLEVFHTQIGSIALCVDVDVYRPEITRIASNMGAQIIICSQSINQGDYSSHMVLTGAWNAAQIAGAYVIAVTNQFNCVCAPIESTTLRDGFLNPPNLKMPMIQRMVANKLEGLPKPRALSRRFYALHRAELIGEKK